MPSKLQVLTEDTAGNAALWDIWRGEIASRHAKKARAPKGLEGAFALYYSLLAACYASPSYSL